MMKRDHTPHAGSHPRCHCQGLMSSPQRACGIGCAGSVFAHSRRAVCPDFQRGQRVELSTGKPLVNLPFDAALASDIYDIVAGNGRCHGHFYRRQSYTDYLVPMRPCLMPPALRRYLRDSRIVVDDMHAVFAAHPHEVESSASPIGTMPPAMPPGRLLPAGLMSRLLPAFPTTWRSTPPA